MKKMDLEGEKKQKKLKQKKRTMRFIISQS